MEDLGKFRKSVSSMKKMHVYHHVSLQPGYFLWALVEIKLISLVIEGCLEWLKLKVLLLLWGNGEGVTYWAIGEWFDSNAHIFVLL